MLGWLGVVVMNKVLTRPPKPAPPKKTADKPDVKPTFATVPVDAQEFGSDGQPRAKLSWLLDALDAVIGMRGAYWKVEYSREEVIDAGGGEKLCSVKAAISKVIAGTANNYVGIGYGCAMLVERISVQQYKKHLDAWDVAQEKALAAAARFFGIGLTMEPFPEDPEQCDNTVFAERLRYYREKADLKQKELADKAGVSFAAYNKYETKGQEPKIEVLIKLANVLGIDVNTLVGYKAANDDSQKDNAADEPKDDAEKEEALAELREAVRKFGLGSTILKIVQFKYGTIKVESLAPGLLRDLKENMIIYREEWQKAIAKEEAAHGNSKRKDT